MEQSPSCEAKRFRASQDIPHILWNPKVHYRIHKCPPSVPIQFMPSHPTSWRSILILSSHLRLGLPSDLLPSGFHTKTLYMPLFSTIRATWPAHLILFDFITRTTLIFTQFLIKGILFCYKQRRIVWNWRCVYFLWPLKLSN